MANLPEYRKGDHLSARSLNGLLGFLRSLRLKSDGSLHITETPEGTVIKANLPQEADFKISGGSNPYAGTEQIPIAGGGWSDMTGGRTVTTVSDPLWERNRNTAVAVNSVVHCRRDLASAAWIFDRASCTTTTTVPIIVSPTGPVTSPPSTPTAPSPPTTPPTTPSTPTTPPTVPPTAPTVPSSPIPPLPPGYPPPVGYPSPSVPPSDPSDPALPSGPLWPDIPPPPPAGGWPGFFPMVSPAPIRPTSETPPGTTPGASPGAPDGGA
jgi:hypothetical protein